MKKFLIKLLAFFLGMAVLDVAIGSLLSYVQQNAKGGQTFRNGYIANNLDADLLIFGSSRAIDHYNPVILRDSLGIDAYNCGMYGNGIIFMYGQYKLITQRYCPRYIIYEVFPNYDINVDDDSKYLKLLRCCYDSDGIDSIFAKVEPSEKIKMISRLRRNNDMAIRYITDFVKSSKNDILGFIPGEGLLTYEPDKKQKRMEESFDDIKAYYLQKLIDDCEANGTKLIFAISPKYRGGNEIDDGYKYFFDLAETNAINILNFYNDSCIINNRNLFMDPLHMNAKGADKYSKRIIPILRNMLQ